MRQGLMPPADAQPALELQQAEHQVPLLVVPLGLDLRDDLPRVG